MNRKVTYSFIAIYCLAAGLGFFLSNDSSTEDLRPASYILQGKSTESVVEAVASVDGQITHEFRIINAVAATLTMQQHEALLTNPAILAINEDASVKTAGGANTRSVSFANIDSAAPTTAEL